MRYVGYRYRFGGTSPSGFDCSGFVYYVFNKAGISMGRDMYSQLGSGPRISSSNLRPGDILFFSNTYKRGLSHAGIYIGNGKFVHAENESTGVAVSALWSSYWAAHYTTAVRP
jgi:cell wall-associated NlpC family hydrolase